METHKRRTRYRSVTHAAANTRKSQFSCTLSGGDRIVETIPPRLRPSRDTAGQEGFSAWILLFLLPGYCVRSQYYQSLPAACAFCGWRQEPLHRISSDPDPEYNSRNKQIVPYFPLTILLYLPNPVQLPEQIYPGPCRICWQGNRVRPPFRIRCPENRVYGCRVRPPVPAFQDTCR